MPAKKKDKNPLREFIWTVCGKKYTVRPEWEIIARIETLTDKGMSELIIGFTRQKVKVLDLVHIVSSALENSDLSEDDIGKDIMKIGPLNYASMIAPFMNLSLMGSNEADEENVDKEKNETT